MLCVLQDDLCSFFNALMTCSGAQLDSGNSVINCSITRDKGPPYAFIKLRSVQEASNSLAFNGIQFRGHTLKVCSCTDCMQTQGPSLCVNLCVGMCVARGAGHCCCSSSTEKVSVLHPVSDSCKQLLLLQQGRKLGQHSHYSAAVPGWLSLQLLPAAECLKQSGLGHVISQQDLI